MDKKTKIRTLLKPDRLVEEHDAQFYALPRVSIGKNSAGSGILGNLQHYAKSYPRLYQTLVILFSPVFVRPSSVRRLQQTIVKFDPEETVVLNLGSGPSDFWGRPDFINVDTFDFEHVDLIADAHELPIFDGSADMVISMSLFEHVREPARLLTEIGRVLKPGGTAISCIPFIAPFHAAPADYTRWTERGVRQLFRDFDGVEVEIWGGPTSGLLWLAQNWLALVLSLGNARVRDVLAILFMLVTFPLKLLDLAVAGLRGAEQLASTFLITAVKRPARTHDKAPNTIQ